MYLNKWISYHFENILTCQGWHYKVLFLKHKGADTGPKRKKILVLTYTVITYSYLKIEMTNCRIFLIFY